MSPDPTKPAETSTTPEAQTTIPDPTKNPEPEKDEAASAAALAHLPAIKEAKEKAAQDSQSSQDQMKLTVIQSQKTKNEEDQKQLQQQESTAARKKEGWVNNPDKNNEASPEIAEAVDTALKEGDKKKLLDDMGITDEANITILKATLTEIVTDFFHKNVEVKKLGAVLGGPSGMAVEKARIKGVLDKYATDTLLKKIKFLFSELSATYESNKNLYDSPIKLLTAFSDFTNTKFIDTKGLLLKDKLKDCLLLEETSYASSIENFKKLHGLKAAKTKLDGEEASLSTKSSTASIEDLFKDKKIALTKAVTFTIPEKSEDLATKLQEEITKVLPDSTDAETKKKIIDHLTEKLNTQIPAPKANEQFTLAVDGLWSKVSPEAKAAETKAAEDAAKAAAEKANPGTPSEKAEAALADFNIQDFFKNPFETIMKFLSMLFGKMGLSSILGGEKPEDFLKEWKNSPPTDKEKAEVPKLFEAGKKYFKDTKNFITMLKDPDATRAVLKEKAKAKDDETWDSWIPRYLSETEKDDITTSKTLNAAAVAGKLTSPNTAQDKPAELLQKPAGAPATTPATVPAAAVAGAAAATSTAPSKPETDQLSEKKLDVPKTISELNALKVDSDWKEKITAKIGVHGSMFSDIRELTKDSENKLDPEIKTYLKAFLDTIGKIENEFEIKALKLYGNPTETGSAMYKKTLAEMKKEPDWKIKIEQQIQNSKEFSIKCHLSQRGIDSRDNLMFNGEEGAAAKEVALFLQNDLNSTLKAKTVADAKEFAEYQTSYEKIKHDFPGFEKAMEMVMPYNELW